MKIKENGRHIPIVKKSTYKAEQFQLFSILFCLLKVRIIIQYMQERKGKERKKKKSTIIGQNSR